MGAETRIGWTDHTFNPWWGCTEVSPGCDHCYARAWAGRFGAAPWGHGVERRRTSEANWRQVLRWDAAAAAAGVRRRVFCASMADVFDAEVPDEWRSDLWGLIGQTQHLDWLLLTKRPNNIRRMTPEWLRERPDVWFGTSVESEEYLWRASALVQVDAAGPKFLSCEPLLGPLPGRLLATFFYSGYIPAENDRISWVIVGAESGPGRRPFEVEWALDIQRRCEASGVAFYAKQGPGLRSEQPFGDARLDGPGARAWPAGGVKA